MCKRTDCTSGLPATYFFLLEDDDFEVRYCASCVAFCVTNGYFSPYEVYTLNLLH